MFIVDSKYILYYYYCYPPPAISIDDFFFLYYLYHFVYKDSFKLLRIFIISTYIVGCRVLNLRA